MERIERDVEVNAPRSVVYNQWTRFEDFPRFMEGVERVEQLDDQHVRWVAKIAGAQREWDSEITRQEPDDVIAWVGFGEADHMGVIEFDDLSDDRTRVTVRVDWEPQGAAERVADTLGIVERRIAGDLDRFAHFIEERGVASGWRGTIPEDATQAATVPEEFA